MEVSPELLKLRIENAKLKNELITLKMTYGKAPEIESWSDRRLVVILKLLKKLGVIKSWYYNGAYHAL